MFPRTIKNVNTWYFHTKTSTLIDCLSTYFYQSLVRKTVCFGLYIDKTCVPDIFSESPLNTDTRIIRTLWHVPLVSIYIKSVSMRKPGRTRQGVIMLKSPISLKLGTNVRYQELTYVTEFQVKIFNSLGDPGSPCKNHHFCRFIHN